MSPSDNKFGLVPTVVAKIQPTYEGMKTFDWPWINMTEWEVGWGHQWFGFEKLAQFLKANIGNKR